MVEVIQLLSFCFGLPLLVVLVLSGQWQTPKAWGFGFLGFASLTATILAVAFVPALLPHSKFIDALKWNWIGKIASITATLLIFICLPKNLKREAGLLTLPKPPEWISVIAVSLVLIVGFWGIVYAHKHGGGFAGSAETLAFQGSLPGLDEEISFRGVILALLVAAFAKPWRFLGVDWGWGAVPIIAFFGMAHGFSSISNQIQIDWVAVAVTGLTGFGLFWIKERTGSIWVCVLVHNLINVGAIVFDKI